MFRPMLAAKMEGESLSSLAYPKFASPKLDGIRAIVLENRLYSRSMKLIPNAHVQRMFGRPELLGLDGELILGDPTSPTAFRDTTSAVMSHEGTPEVVFHVFDKFHETLGFKERLVVAAGIVHKMPMVQIVPHVVVRGPEEVELLEEQFLKDGYEGVMLRSMSGKYKNGRSTLREEGLIKIKRFHDSEAVIQGCVEFMHNDNEAKLDERGYMKRSSHKDNMRPGGMLGALTVKDCDTGAIFEIGSGFDNAERVALWNQREALPGRVVRYRYFPTGTIDKPRFPTFEGFRSTNDM